MPSSEAVRRALEPSAEELYEDAPCGYLSMLQDGTLAKVNRTLLRSTGYASEELLGRRLHDLLAPGSRIYHETHWGPRLALEGEVREVPVDLVRADGTRLTALLNAVLTRTAEGHPSVIRASVFDATDRRRYERELVASRDVERDARRQSERLLAALKTRSALQSAVVGLSTRALEGIALADLLEEATATVREALGAGHVAVVTSAAEAPEIPSGSAGLDVPVGPPSRSWGRLQVARAAGGPFSEGEAAFLDAVGTVLANAMERRRIEDATRHRALHDALTGLPNRTKLDADLQAQIRQAQASGSAFALCLLDLDDFKLVNDTYGHAAGDTLLQAVGDRLKQSVRPHDTVARLGGDEFVVLAGDVTSAGGPEAIAERLIACLQRPLVIHGATHSVRTSMGVVSGGADSLAADVLRDADIAMYEAKARGRGQYAHFDASMRDRLRTRIRIEAELREALREGHLRVFYQPVVRSGDGRLVGFEALVRWEHPVRGLIPPDAFIPVAEDCGLIVDVGSFVLDEACRQLVAWREDGVVADDVSVAVNVSARQLALPGFAAEVASVLARHGLESAPRLLGLEITESLLMGTGESAGATLAALAALGVGLLLDDFGTGASSLARLKRFPVDTLKIDRAFITGLGAGSEADDAIVAAIVALAGKLNLRVVAEGVETSEQLDVLRELGCDCIQGYLISRPKPAGDLAGELECGGALSTTVCA